MATHTTCAAPNCTALPSSGYHCPSHERVFVPLYRAYKEAEKAVERRVHVDLRKGGVPKLLTCYARLEAVYKMRSEYRERAFRRELWDSGHSSRISRVLEWMYEVERRLETLFSEANREETVPLDPGTSSMASLVTKETRRQRTSPTSHRDEMGRIRDHNAKALEEERTWNETIPGLILERTRELEEGRLVTEKLLSLYRGLLKRDQRRYSLFTESVETTHYVTFVNTYLMSRYFLCSKELISLLSRGQASHRREGGTRHVLVFTIPSIGNHLYDGYKGMEGILRCIRKYPEYLSVISDILYMAVDVYCTGSERHEVRVGVIKDDESFDVLASPVCGEGNGGGAVYVHLRGSVADGGVIRHTIESTPL